MAETYSSWAARMKASGGVVVALPQSVFKGAKDVPAVRFPAARLEELRKAGVLPYGAPDATVREFVYFAAPGALKDAAKTLGTATDAEGERAGDQLLKQWRDWFLKTPLGDSISKLGNVAFWLIVAVLVYIAWRFARAAGRVAE